jgi:Pyridine nucleotide-disulphide oxidoreductase, dimerisation domain
MARQPESPAEREARIQQILRLLGVHVMGERAAEIIHIGQAVLALGGTLEYFRDAVFNYPTMAEAYKVAAADGLGKLRPSRRSEAEEAWQEIRALISQRPVQRRQ